MPQPRRRAWGPAGSLGGRARAEPLADQRALLIGDARGVVDGHGLADHRLLVHGLRVAFQLRRAVQPHALGLQGLAVAHGAALRHHGLHLGRAHRRPRRHRRRRRGLEPHDHPDEHHHARCRVFPGVRVAAQLEAVTQHEELPDRRARGHHGDQHPAVVRVRVGEAVVVAEHGEQHRQREVGVVHAALLAALAMDRVHRLPCLERGHHLALARDDPEKHVGAHGRGDHGAHQQEGRAAREQRSGQQRRRRHQQRHRRAHLGVTVLRLPQRAADGVVGQPEHHQKRQRAGDGHRRRPVEDLRVDQVDAGAPQIGHQEQREAREPSGVALPEEPVQMPRQLRRRHSVLHRVIEAAAVHGPQLPGGAIAAQRLVLGRGEAAVEEDEVEGRADPGNGDDHVQPAQQQIGPVEQVGFHGTSFRGRGVPFFDSPPRAL